MFELVDDACVFDFPAGMLLSLLCSFRHDDGDLIALRTVIQNLNVLGSKLLKWCVETETV